MFSVNLKWSFTQAVSSSAAFFFLKNLISVHYFKKPLSEASIKTHHTQTQTQPRMIKLSVNYKKCPANNVVDRNW